MHFHSLFVGGKSSFIVVTNSLCGTGSASGAGEGFSGMKEGGTSGSGAGCWAGAGLRGAVGKGLLSGKCVSGDYGVMVSSCAKQ